MQRTLAGDVEEGYRATEETHRYEEELGLEVRGAEPVKVAVE